MQNYFTLETEAEFRRQEWERAVVAKAKADLVCSANDRTPWSETPRRLRARLRAIFAQTLPSSSWQNAADGALQKTATGWG